MPPSPPEQRYSAEDVERAAFQLYANGPWGEFFSFADEGARAISDAHSMEVYRNIVLSVLDSLPAETEGLRTCTICDTKTDKLYGGEGRYPAQCWGCWKRGDRAEIERDQQERFKHYANERADRAEAEADRLREEVEARQAAIDKAHSALSSSQYVGGPTEREAWRIVTEALYPYVTQHIGANPGAESRFGPDGKEKE